MIELKGNETKHEADMIKVMNLQEQIMDNLYEITKLEDKIRMLKAETNELDKALEYWKNQCHNTINNLKAEITTKKKPATK